MLSHTIAPGRQQVAGPATSGPILGRRQVGKATALRRNTPSALSRTSSEARDGGAIGEEAEYAPDVVNEVLQSPGQQLPAQSRKNLQSRFSFPLSAVRYIVEVRPRVRRMP